MIISIDGACSRQEQICFLRKSFSLWLPSFFPVPRLLSDVGRETLTKGNISPGPSGTLRSGQCSHGPRLPWAGQSPLPSCHWARLDLCRAEPLSCPHLPRGSQPFPQKDLHSLFYFILFYPTGLCFEAYGILILHPGVEPRPQQ